MIRDVLLLASYPASSPSDPSLRRVGNLIYLDWQLQMLKDLGARPVVVIGGNGDELLLHSHKLFDEDMVFDSNETPTIWTALWAGVHAAAKACFILPIEVPVPDQKYWLHVEHEIREEFWGQNPIIGAPAIQKKIGFPWVLNGSISKLIKDANPAETKKLVDEKTTLVPTTPNLGQPDPFLNLSELNIFEEWARKFQI